MRARKHHRCVRAHGKLRPCECECVCCAWWNRTRLKKAVRRRNRLISVSEREEREGGCERGEDWNAPPPLKCCAPCSMVLMCLSLPPSFSLSLSLSLSLSPSLSLFSLNKLSRLSSVLVESHQLTPSFRGTCVQP